MSGFDPAHCFTGKQKLVDTAGRVERFQRKYGLKRSGSGSTPA